jgi:hypothetical protein
LNSLKAFSVCIVSPKSLTPRLTGAGGRRPQGTKAGHKNGEAMASFGVRVEPPVRNHLLLAIM